MNDGNIACSGTSATKAYNNTFICGSGNNTYCNQLTVGEDYRNNVQINPNTGFGILTSTTSGTSGTFDYNIYGSPYSTPFYISAVQSNYATWKAALGGGLEAHSPSGNVYSGITSIHISSAGIPQAGFVGIAVGANLTTLCTGFLVPLCTDPNGNARPNSAWDIGAYQFSTGAQVPPSPSAAIFSLLRRPWQ